MRESFRLLLRYGFKRQSDAVKKARDFAARKTQVQILPYLFLDVPLWESLLIN
jgi:hypothetical protein